MPDDDCTCDYECTGRVDDTDCPAHGRRPTEVVGITLTVQTDNPETVARTIEVIARTAAGLALETGLNDGVTITIVRFEPDQEDAEP